MGSLAGAEGVVQHDALVTPSRSRGVSSSCSELPPRPDQVPGDAQGQVHAQAESEGVEDLGVANRPLTREEATDVEHREQHSRD